MEIRRLNALDAEEYREIRLEGLQMDPEAFLTNYEEELEQPLDKYKIRFQAEDSYTFGAFEDSHLVGVITLFREKALKLRHRASLAAIYVTPKKRGLGIGKSLVEKTIEQVGDLEGVEQVYLTVVSTNVAAKRLYEKLGFKEFGFDKRALKSEEMYFDEVHMVLFL